MWYCQLSQIKNAIEHQDNETSRSPADAVQESKSRKEKSTLDYANPEYITNHGYRFWVELYQHAKKNKEYLESLVHKHQNDHTVYDIKEQIAELEYSLLE